NTQPIYKCARSSDASSSDLKAAALFAKFDAPGDRDVELGEERGRLLGVQDDHLLGDDDEEERGPRPVGQDLRRGVDARLDVQEVERKGGVEGAGRDGEGMRR